MQCTSTITALARVPPDPASRFGSLAASQHQSLSQTTHRHASGCRLRPAAGFAPSRRSQAPPGSLPCPLTGPSAACDAPTMRTAHRSWGVRRRPRDPRPAHHSDAHPGPNDSLGRSPGHTTPSTIPLAAVHLLVRAPSTRLATHIAGCPGHPVLPLVRARVGPRIRTHRAPRRAAWALAYAPREGSSTPVTHAVAGERLTPADAVPAPWAAAPTQARARWRAAPAPRRVAGRPRPRAPWRPRRAPPRPHRPRHATARP